MTLKEQMKEEVKFGGFNEDGVYEIYYKNGDYKYLNIAEFNKGDKVKLAGISKIVYTNDSFQGEEIYK
jgi:hypothetical protein